MYRKAVLFSYSGYQEIQLVNLSCTTSKITKNRVTLALDVMARPNFLRLFCSSVSDELFASRLMHALVRADQGPKWVY